jgi:hypothetical protein
LTVYSASAVDIADTEMDAPDVGLAMFGASGEDCDTIMIKGYGMFLVNSENQIGGLPTYWSYDEDMFAYFVGAENMWYVTTKSNWEKVLGGTTWYHDKLDKSSLTCGCRDSENGVGGFTGLTCSEVKAPYNKYGNVQCDTSEHQDRVTRYCPVTCGAEACPSSDESGSSGDESGSDVGLAMFGASGEDCDTIMIPGQGMFLANSEKKIGGLPSYWSSDMEDFAYFVGAEDKWYVIGATYWEQVLGGTRWSHDKVDKSSITCGCQDSENGVGGFSGLTCSEVKAPDYKYYNVQCDTSEYQDLVTRYCPVTCGAKACPSSSRSLGHPHIAIRRLKKGKPDKQTSTATVTRSCEDQNHTGIKLNETSTEEATCGALRSYCQMDTLVAAKCCATCVTEASEKALSNGGCADDPHFTFTIASSLEVNMAKETISRDLYNCSGAAGYCDLGLVREHCCDICKVHEELSSA